MTSDLEPRAVRLLKEMGIDVWRPRRQAERETSSVPVRPARREDVREAAGIPAEAGSPPPAPEPVAPFSVLCLGNPGAVLLVESADVRSARRFAADLLGSITGVWGGETRQLVFEWPQPGISPSADAVARALGAFVGKQLADNEGALVMVGGEVAARLSPGALPADCLVLPPFDALMTDGSLKRALWQELASRRS